MKVMMWPKIGTPPTTKKKFSKKTQNSEGMSFPRTWALFACLASSVTATHITTIEDIPTVEGRVIVHSKNAENTNCSIQAAVDVKYVCPSGSFKSLGTYVSEPDGSFRVSKSSNAKIPCEHWFNTHRTPLRRKRSFCFGLAASSFHVIDAAVGIAWISRHADGQHSKCYARCSMDHKFFKCGNLHRKRWDFFQPDNQSEKGSFCTRLVQFPKSSVFRVIVSYSTLRNYKQVKLECG